MSSAKPVRTPPAAPAPPAAAYRDWLTAAVLAGVTFVAYLPALNCQFVSLDDPPYVTQNPHVRGGLSPADMLWAFTTVHEGNWHPLTWLSLQLDASLWGLNPYGFHLTNVLLHAANAALLFAALRALTGAHWPSAAAALLFAVHPLRAESVAWVTERKDLLSGAFGLATLWAYSAYVARPSPRRYLAVAAAFVLSLLAKPMLVTMPCLLLVLDWWPLGRVTARAAWRGLVREKLPLVALAVGSSVVTFNAQSSQHAMGGEQLFPPEVRLANAAVAYAAYLAKTVWPVDLAVFYPHPLAVDPGKVAGAVVLLLAMTGGAVYLRKRAPYLLAGWLWFLGTLVPVIGLVQVGGQAYADRYTYFPQIGLLLALCWGAADLARSRPQATAAVGLAGGLALGLAVLTWNQVRVWTNSVTLWEHALHAAGENPVAADFLGMAWQEQGRDDEAARCFELTCRLAPSQSQGYTNLAKVRFKQGNREAAQQLFEQAIQRQPPSPDAYCNLGLMALNRKEAAQAVPYFQKAIEVLPRFSDAHSGLGLALVQLGRGREGMAELQAAVDINPRSVQSRANLARVLEAQNDLDGAAAQYRAIVELTNSAAAWYSLGRVRNARGRFAEAVECFEHALERDPSSGPVRSALETARRARDNGGNAARPAG